MSVVQTASAVSLSSRLVCTETINSNAAIGFESRWPPPISSAVDETPIDLCAERSIGGFRIRRHEIVAAHETIDTRRRARACGQSSDRANRRLDLHAEQRGAGNRVAAQAFNAQAGGRIVGIDRRRQALGSKCGDSSEICQREEDMEHHAGPSKSQLS